MVGGLLMAAVDVFAVEEEASQGVVPAELWKIGKFFKQL